MPATRSSCPSPSARGAGRGPRRPRRLLIAVAVAVCASLLSASVAFGEGSVDVNLGPGGQVRHGLTIANPGTTAVGTTRTLLQVYAQAGETIQMADSVMGFPGANILLFAPGQDPATATPAMNCALSQPLSGQIASRAQELAGPQPNVGGYDACDFTAAADGVYTVIMQGTSSDNGVPGTVDTPNIDASQGRTASMYDVTVRDAGGAVQRGRLFSRQLSLRSTSGAGASGDFQGYVYTKTGYEFRVTFYEQSGLNWILAPDDLGVIDAATGDRTFASFACGDEANPDVNRPCVHFEAELGPADRRYPVFFSAVDPLVITGTGGLATTLGYSPVPISPGSNPLANAAFTGSGAQSGATNLGSGGTIAFTSPKAMEGLGYTIAIDTNRDGTFGNGYDVVDATRELAGDGANAYAWNGRDAQGNVPPCGDYPYQIRSTLSEVHFAMQDVENSGGTQIERLSLPADPALGNPLAASYNNHDPYKSGFVVTNGTTAAVANGISGTGFNAWTGNTGNTDFVDTWTRLPEVQTTGTLRLLCADPQVVKSAEPSPAVPGEDLTFHLAVRNNGPDAATNVRATDVLPRGVRFKSASPGCAEASGTVTCTLGSLAAGATQTFDVVVTVDSGIDSCIDNTARVANDTPDTNLSNNESSVCVPLEGRVDLSITKVPSRAQVPAGGQVMYTLVVHNHGPSDDRGVTVTDPMASGLKLVSARPSQGTCSTANNTVSCDMGELRADGSAQVLVVADVTAASGCVSNTARVRGAREETGPGNNQDAAQVCVTPTPDPRFDLVVTKTADDRDVLIGQPVTYRIVVRNNGPAAASDVRLTDTVNAAVTVVSVKATAGSCGKAIPMTCGLGTIAAGKQVTITIVAKHRESGCRQRNAASATGAGTDADPANNMDTVDVCVRRVKLRLTKVASRTVVRGGETFTYRIRASNPTKGEAHDVKVCDRLPFGLTYVSSSPKARRSGRQQCWTITRLAAGKSRTFQVRVRAARGAIGRKTNTATLTSPDISRTLRARRTVRILGAPTPVTG